MAELLRVHVSSFAPAMAAIATDVSPAMATPMWSSALKIFFWWEESSDWALLTLASTTWVLDRSPIAADPYFTASIAYSTWNKRPYGLHVATFVSYWRRKEKGRILVGEDPVVDWNVVEAWLLTSGLGWARMLVVAGSGAIPLNRDQWTDGYFSDVAKLVGGVWLRVWVQVAATMSTIGMFVAEMSGDSFQLLGMAERGMLPAFFAKRSRYGTPLVGILFSASGVILLSWLSFEEIVAAENFLYCFGMILEFISFIRLRIKYPAATRPFKIPVGTVGSILLCIPPTILIGAVLALSSLKVAVISLVAVVIGLVMQPCLKHVEKKKWLKFSKNSDLPDPLCGAAHENSTETLVQYLRCSDVHDSRVGCQQRAVVLIGTVEWMHVEAKTAGAIPLNRDLWTDGYFSDVAKLVGGVWLRVWIQVAAAMSTIGMFEAEMSGDSFQLLGMAERGMLPTFFAKRSRYGTPLVGILFSASGVILLSWLSFEEIVTAENFLYCFGMVLEFISFIRLRIKYPATSRPFKIPVGTVGSILLCIPPTISIGVVLALSSLKVAVISLVAVVIGLVMQPCLKHVEKKKWLKFSENSDLPDPLCDAAHEDTETLIH
ncbi:hypothetical protein RHGRI_020595 [Rhododendron griersonianum]|uniref:Polyamine transporter n=1 Tax=Rhododendron griersonianum TaxID=479676 RepID=A0AAV6JLI9_9ERIC|nr:hypothetical protein RHGRI_020595 [Rhododendron griersonianum]